MDSWSPLHFALAHLWESALVLQAVETTNAEVRASVRGECFFGRHASIAMEFNVAEEVQFLKFFHESNLVEVRFEII